MSMKFPSTPRSGEPTPKAPPAEAADDDLTVESLFDARPADEAGKPGLLESALSSLSQACRDAAAWIAQVFSFMRSRDDASIDISRPFNVRREALPEDFQKAIDAELVSRKTAAVRQEFVESAETAPTAKAAPPDPDKDAFDAWVRLCKRDRKPPGTLDCPQNFADKAARHAQDFVDMVADRQAHALQEKKEFWLGTEDQEKLRFAKALLRQAQGPIQANSTQQVTSFMAWREWSRHPEKVPDDPGFSIDAAVAYAHELCKVHAGKDVAKDPRTKDMLAGAYELIAREEHYRRNFDVQSEAVQLIRQIDALQEPAIPPAVRESMPALDAPPAPPPPRVRSTPADTGGTAPPAGNPPPPPSLRVPSSRPMMPESWNDLPELSTLESELQIEASVLLNRFFQRYAEQLDSGVLDFANSPEYFSPLAATAAIDFLRRADNQPDVTDPRSYAAANYIVREYEHRRQVLPGTGS